MKNRTAELTIKVSKTPAGAPEREHDLPLAVTIQQALEITSLSRSFLYKKFETGELTRLKAGRRVLIMRDELLCYLSSIRK
ncbi:hypothetical protein [Mesorhizobium sp. KR2-14]|uniref:hypothetical protein n=1 Tax=Mesorhizobium sp. KR2-14 TaxID=3156610 RepID=UPI0032B47AC2